VRSSLVVDPLETIWPERANGDGSSW